MFAFIAALESELAPLRRRLRARPLGVIPGLRRCWRATTTEQELILAVTGMGPQRAAVGTSLVVERWRPAAVAAVGYAGALVPRLRRGDVVICRAVASAEGDLLHGASQLLTAARRAAADAGLPYHEGIGLTVERIVRTPTEKARLAAQALVVDMESYAIARVAAGAGLPFLALRAVSDEASQPLPDVAAFLDAAGQLRPGALAAYLLRRPWHVARLAQLGLGARKASTNLARVVLELVGTGNPL